MENNKTRKTTAIAKEILKLSNKQNQKRLDTINVDLERKAIKIKTLKSDLETLKTDANSREGFLKTQAENAIKVVQKQLNEAENNLDLEIEKEELIKILNQTDTNKYKDLYYELFESMTIAKREKILMLLSKKNKEINEILDRL